MTMEAWERLEHIARLFDEQDGLCWLCDKDMLRSAMNGIGQKATLDHIIPLSVGGDDDEANLRLAHADCNAARGSTHEVFSRALIAVRLCRGHLKAAIRGQHRLPVCLRHPVTDEMIRASFRNPPPLWIAHAVQLYSSNAVAARKAFAKVDGKELATSPTAPPPAQRQDPAQAT